jgi:hypothetical protein
MKNEILTFIKEWVPSIGILIGGSWVLFNKFFEERTRRKKEMPALIGKVSSETIEIEDKILLNLEIDWSNTSPLPIYIDTEKTRIDLYLVEEIKKLGYFEAKKDLGSPLFKAFPLKDMADFVFEPNTLNQIRANFLLKERKIYFLRIKIYRDRSKHGAKTFAWTREKLIDLRKK